MLAGLVLVAALLGPSPTRAASPAIPSAAAQSVVPEALFLSSTSTTGVKGNGGSDYSSLSSSGQQVAFQSVATNLDPADTDAVRDIYVKDLGTGVLTLASSSDTGVKGNGESDYPGISGDASSVAFQSKASNLDPADTDGLSDVYVKDLGTGRLLLASTSDTGAKGNGESTLGTLARAGNKVAFQSISTNLDPADTDPIDDIYVKTLTTGDIVLASVTKAGVKGNGSSGVARISETGKRVAFETLSNNLNSKDTDLVHDIYVKELGTGRLLLASTSDTGVKGNGGSVVPEITSAGNRVAFLSTATNLDPGDTDPAQDCYVKNLGTGDIVLASSTKTGVKGNGNVTRCTVSKDGRKAAFVTASTNLDPADSDTLPDVYVKDLGTGDVSLASMTVDGLKGTSGAIQEISMSGKGQWVAFDSTAKDLDPGDTDFLADVYVKQPIVCTVAGTSGPDDLVGTGGADVICGRGGDDTLHGADGNDVLAGEAGNDTIEGGAGADTMDGGGDTDVADYETSTGEVTVDLISGTGIGGDANGDLFSGFESLAGSSNADLLAGDAGANTLTGNGGDDILIGRGSGDALLGLDGIDTIDYEDSPAAVTVDLSTGTTSGGDAADDIIDSIESVVGSAFADRLTGDAGANYLMGMAGGDTIDGGAGVDMANYAFSPSRVQVDLFTGATQGGDAVGDVLTGIENLSGSPFNDELSGDAEDNYLLGGDGNDQLSGDLGDDVLTGGAGTDTFSGGSGTDTCDNVTGETATSCEI